MESPFRYLTEMPTNNFLIKNRFVLNSLIIFSLIFALLGGSNLVIANLGALEVSAYRFVLVIAVGYLFITGQLVFYTNRFSRLVFYFFIIWFLYGIVSLIWTPDLIYGIKELFYLGIGTLTFFVFLSFSHFEKDFKRILENALVVSFITVIGFLVAEMVTQKHLEGEYLRRLTLLGGFHKANFVPVFTFVNPNVAAIYLCITIALSAWFLINNRNIILHIAIILTAFDFLLLMESRLGVLSMLAILLATSFLLFFKSVRSKISLSFSKSQKLAFFLLIGLNSVVLYSEFQFLKSESSWLEQDNASCNLCYTITDKIYKKIARDGRILLTSNTSSVEESDSPSLIFDRVFVIENETYIKLLDNKHVDLEYKEINQDLHKDLFMGDNLFLVGSVILLFIFLIVVFILSNRFVKIEWMVLLSVLGLFVVLLLLWNSYKFPSEKYKRRVLVEKGSSVNRLKKTDLNIISADFQLGKAFLTKKSVVTHLFTRNEETSVQSYPKEEISSNSIRKNLALNGLDYLQKSHYMGIGAGGFLASNMKKLNKYPDGGVGGAHNFIIEILSQYGVIIFALLVGLFLIVISILISDFNKGIWDKKHFLVLWLLIILIFMGNANSSFLSLPMNWLLVTFLLIFANTLIVEKERPNEIKD